MTDSPKPQASTDQDASNTQVGSRAAAAKEAAAEKAKANKSQKKPLSFKWLLWVILLSVLLLLGFGGWSGVKQLSLLNTQNEEALAELSNTTSEQLANIHGKTVNQEARVADLAVQQAKMVTAFEQLVAQVRNMPQLSDARGNQWRLAEAEYLTRLAQRKLLLEQDVETSITLLQSADVLIASMGEPSTDVLRQSFQQKILALESLELADVDDMVLQLDAMMEFSSQLPLPNLKAIEADANVVESTEADSLEPQNTWKKALQDNWQAIKGLVRVRQLDKPVKPLLPPEQKVYLEQNLRLLLEQAQLAALRRDAVLFQSRLSQAKEWVETYFFVEDAKVRAMVAKLDTLLAAPMTAELPDVGALVSDVSEFKHQYLFSALQPKARQENQPNKAEAQSAEQLLVPEDRAPIHSEDSALQE